MKPQSVLAPLALLTIACAAHAQSLQAVQAKAKEHEPLLLDSLKQLVSIESGSRDLDGLAEAAKFIAGRLQAGGMAVQVLPTKVRLRHARRPTFARSKTPTSISSKHSCANRSRTG